MFNQLQFPADQIAAEGARVASQIEAQSPGADPAQFAGQIIAQRLRERPECYVEFGPYWWAVKAALYALEDDFGPEDDPLVLDAYGGALQPFEALVAGELFKDFYRATYLGGTVQFWLDDADEESYVLFDANMEARRLGPGAVAQAVAANLNAIELPAEPENQPA